MKIFKRILQIILIIIITAVIMTIYICADLNAKENNDIIINNSLDFISTDNLNKIADIKKDGRYELIVDIRGQNVKGNVKKTTRTYTDDLYQYLKKPAIIINFCYISSTHNWYIYTSTNIKNIHLNYINDYILNESGGMYHDDEDWIIGSIRDTVNYVSNEKITTIKTLDKPIGIENLIDEHESGITFMFILICSFFAVIIIFIALGAFRL